MEFKLRYMFKNNSRNWVRCLLSIVLAALLFFAFGLLTSLRGIYAKLYQEVDVRAVLYGGVPYETAQKISESEYVTDPYYEHINKDCDIELHTADTVFTNKFPKDVAKNITWLNGWNEEKFMSSTNKVCVMFESHAAEYGLALGNMVRFEEKNFTSMLIDGLSLKEKVPQEFILEKRDAVRPKLQIVGIVKDTNIERMMYIPLSAWRNYTWMLKDMPLDLASYSLVDYHESEAFETYAKSILSQVKNVVKIHIDTSEADRIYNIHRLIETLYPITVVAALLLGGILPGLTVLHCSKEISTLRALGTKKRTTIFIYTLGQLMLAFVGLLLGVGAMFLTKDLNLAEVTKPFALYFVGHILACGLGSGIFAWLAARKDVLSLLQARE